MSLEVLKCPNCGAPMSADVVGAVVVCPYCTRSVANPAMIRGGAPQAPAPVALRKGSVAVESASDEEGEEDEEGEVFEWTEENITAYARETLGERDSLYFDPDIPKDKLKAARGVHKDGLERDERVLVLFDDTVFGGADDGFIVTTERLAWKNIMMDPTGFLWTEIDPEQVEWSDEGLKVMGEEIQVTQGDSATLFPALGEFIYEMASMAQEFDDEEEDE